MQLRHLLPDPGRVLRQRREACNSTAEFPALPDRFPAGPACSPASGEHLQPGMSAPVHEAKSGMYMCQRSPCQVAVKIAAG